MTGTQAEIVRMWPIFCALLARAKKHGLRTLPRFGPSTLMMNGGTISVPEAKVRVALEKKKGKSKGDEKSKHPAKHFTTNKN